MKNLNDNEVETVFDLYRRGNTLRKGDFPNEKNGLKPFIREGNPGNLVDEGSLEYLRSQYLDRLYDLPVDSKQIGEFKERINKLRTEFYNRYKHRLRPHMANLSRSVIRPAGNYRIFWKTARCGYPR